MLLMILACLSLHRRDEELVRHGLGEEVGKMVLKSIDGLTISEDWYEDKRIMDDVVYTAAYTDLECRTVKKARQTDDARHSVR